MTRVEPTTSKSYVLLPVERPFPGREVNVVNESEAQAKLLREFNHALISQLDLDSLLRLIFQSVREMFQQTIAATLSIHDVEKDELRIHLLHSDDPDLFREGMPLPFRGTPSGVAFTSRQAVLIHRLVYEDFPTPLIGRALADGIKSGCSVPLVSYNRVVGALTVGAAQEGAYSEEDVSVLNQIAAQISMPIENALNFRSAERQRDRNRLLLTINNAVVSHLDLKDLVKTISAALRDIMPHDSAGIALYEAKHNHLREYTNVNYKDLEAFKIGDTIPIEGTRAGEVFTTGKPLLIKRPNPADYPNDRYALMSAEGSPKSACLAPLVSHGRKLGIAGVSSTQEEKFTEEDLELFSQVAAQIAIAVQNTLNFQQANKERKRAQMLLEINNAITTSLNLRDLLKTTSACLRPFFDHDVAGLSLYDDSKKKLIIHAMDRNDRFTREGTALPLEGTPVSLAFTSGRPVLRDRVDFDEFPAPEMKAAYDDGWRSGCVVPLIAHDRKLGVLGLASFHEGAFNEADADLLQSIAGQVALAVENTLQFREIESLKNKLASEKLYLEEEIKTQYNFAEIIGESSPLREVLNRVETVAPTDSTVLLIGETGTGKELIARAIHNLSSRHERTLVKLNCAAIPTGLLESELFGHEKGAFTGAIASRIGRFELAHKGTLLLDEIGEIPLELQPKLLRVLQEHEFERLGSSRTIKTDARLIAATNCDLEQMVDDKKFRGDLFYRLNVFPIIIPPLRERTGDIPLLVSYFAQKHAARMNKKIETIPAQTMDALCAYRWPGNVRELENFVERSVILSRGSELQSPLAELHPTAQMGESHLIPDKPRMTTMENMERAYIEEVLRQTKGSIGGKGGAAEILDMPASTLRSRMKKLGIR